jgi:phage anti-repressor protein
MENLNYTEKYLKLFEAISKIKTKMAKDYIHCLGNISEEKHKETLKYIEENLKNLI